MMEKFVDLLKIIAEKHLKGAIASVAITIITVAFLPNLFGIDDKVGKALYGVLIFCIAYLLIECGVHICNSVKSKLKQKRSDELNEKEVLERLWNYVDSLSPQDRNYLFEFHRTGNQPIEVRSNPYGTGLLSNRDIVVCTEKQQKCAPELNRNPELAEQSNFHRPNIPYKTSPTSTKLYRLKDSFFELLKYSYDKYGKISHFDTEE